MSQSKQPSYDEMFQQIAKILGTMEEVIQSHEAEIKRIKFRIDRIERTRSP